MATWVILGCGYVGNRLARALLADGHEVRAAARNLERLAPLAALGAQLFEVDGAKRRSFGPVLYGTRDARVVFSIPPIPGMPPGSTIGRAAEAAQAAGCKTFVYLGSTAVYGETPSGEIVDESSPIAISDAEAAPRLAEEMAVGTAALSGLHTVVLRLAAIYGPGRGVRERLKLGNYQLIDDGVHYYSRIHVDDLCGIIRTAAESAPAGATYCCGDDRPATQREYVEWLSARMGLPMPPSVESLAPGKRRRPVRNRRVANDHVKTELGYRFRYPSFVEGEQAIEAEQSGAPVGMVAPAPTPAPAVQAAPAAARAFDPAAVMAAVTTLVAALRGATSNDERATLESALVPLREALGEVKR